MTKQHFNIITAISTRKHLR
uniref:Uncharacterized protein n=1 Tax=Anguilla anguilla TaxID=7936 RepID=A0A0E9R2F4_ANGAN